MAEIRTVSTQTYSIDNSGIGENSKNGSTVKQNTSDVRNSSLCFPSIHSITSTNTTHDVTAEPHHGNILVHLQDKHHLNREHTALVPVTKIKRKNNISIPNNNNKGTHRLSYDDSWSKNRRNSPRNNNFSQKKTIELTPRKSGFNVLSPVEPVWLAGGHIDKDHMVPSRYPSTHAIKKTERNQHRSNDVTTIWQSAIIPRRDDKVYMYPQINQSPPGRIWTSKFRYARGMGQKHKESGIKLDNQNMYVSWWLNNLHSAN